MSNRLRRFNSLRSTGVLLLIGSGLVGSGLVIAGCDAIGSLLPVDVTRVMLTNNTASSVDLELRISDQQEVPRDLLESLGDKVELTVPAGGSIPLQRKCDDLQAIMVKDAKLRVIGQVGPSTSSDVVRDGSDFGCRDTIVFTFEGGPFDFRVTTSVQKFTPTPNASQ